MGKKKEKEKKPYISDRLRKLIYNPELPPNWRLLPDYEKVFMFQKLFLLLNEDFQKEFGKEIDEWFSIYEAVEKHDENYLSNHPWLIVNKKERYIRYKICDECTKNGKLQCKMRIDPRSLIYILIRLEQGPIVERDNHRIINVRYFEKSVSLPSSGDIFISDKIKTPHKVLRDIDIPLFKESIQKLQKGIIPEKVYPEVIIYYSKEKLMKDFEEFIDKMQEIYFKQYPENRSPEYGHKEYKADKWEKKREKKYPFDEFERYFKVYILCEIFSKKQRDVAKEIFPKDTVGSGDAKISQDLRKARKLIENAFTKNFPGKY